MKLSWTAAGITAAVMAMSAAAPAAFAEAANTFVIAQAVDEAALAEAQAILAEAANVQTLSEDDLKDRMKKARQLSNNEGLPEDVREQLKNFVSAARQELVARDAQQQQQQQAEPPPEPQPELQQAEPPPEPQPEQQQAEPPPEPQPEQQQTEQPAEQPQPELQQAEPPPEPQPEQQQAEPPPEPQPEQQQAEPPPEPQPEQQQAEPPPELKIQQPEQQATEPAPEPSAPAAAAVDEDALKQAKKLLSDPRPAAELTIDELRERIKRAGRLSRNEKLPADVREQLKGVVDASQQEIAARETPAQQGGEQPAAQAEPPKVEQAPPPPSEAENRAVDKPKVSSAAEEEAEKLIADTTPLDRLKDQQIKARLETYRNLLEDGNLSRRTERRLRRKLQDERQALRARVAEQKLEERKKEEKVGSEPSTDSFDNGPVKLSRYDEKPSRREMQFVVNDRRPLRDLNEFELQRRIFVFRELSADERYSEDQLQYMRGEMTKARRELRRRFEEEKLTRGRDLDRRHKKKDLDIDIDIVLGGGSSAPPVIWAAEEDDEEIEQQLVARPIRKLERTYSHDELYDEPEVIFTRPEVRESLPGVEIDTIRFGFNEAFVREEEVQSLDRIGGIIERVVTAHPQEVFVIEGHTDAVGSDAYNLGLSKQRAEAVRKILLEFYNIEKDNLITVGLGERYLKISTPDPEQENRRVTVRRATPLLSEYEPEE